MMHRPGVRRERWAALAAMVFACGTAGAQQEIRFSRLTMDQGLSQSSVMAITQCHDGFIWLGTQYGLDRFDGREVRSFRHSPTSPDGLSHGRINALKTASDGHLWVATQAGLDRLEPRTGHIERFEIAFPPDFNGPRSISHFVAEHADGRLFVSVSGLPAVWRPDARQVELLPFDSSLPRSQLALRSKVLDSAGRLWAFNAAGLWRLDEARQHMALVLPLSSQPRSQLYSALALAAKDRLALAGEDEFLLVDSDSLEILERRSLADLGGVDERLNGVATSSDGTIWLPTPHRLLRFDPESRQLIVQVDGVRIGPLREPHRRLQMREHPNGDIWFASQYGLARIEAGSGQLRILQHDPGDPFSIPLSLPQLGVALEIDDEGNVWIGTHLGGAAWHAPARSLFHLIQDRSPIDVVSIPFASQNVIRGIAETVVDGEVHLWLALHHGGIRRLAIDGGGIYRWHQSLHARADEHERLPEDAIWSLAVDPLTEWLWALGDEFLTLIDPQQNRVISATRLSDFGLRADARGRRLLISRDGQTLWLGSAAGVMPLAFSADRRTAVPRAQGVLLDSLEVFGFLELAESAMLVFGSGGVGKLRWDQAEPDWWFDNAQLGLANLLPLHSAALHPDGGWWLGGRESGLGHLQLAQAENGALQPSVTWFGRQDGLVDETIYAMLADDDGRLWLSSNRGLMRWDPALRRVRQFTPADGLQSYEFNNGVALRSPRGYFYFGGINGVSQFRPEHFERLLSPPRPRLQEVRINGAERAALGGSDPPLRLRHDENDLELRFVALNFADPLRVRHAFKLEGVDADWVESGAQRQVRYVSLAPGNYRFWLRAGNSDGIWSEPELMLSVVVARPPWASAWALASYGILIMLTGGAVYWEQLRRRRVLEAEVTQRTAAVIEQRRLIEHQARELKAALDSRTTLFANVSHEFRTPLTLIKTSLDRLERQGADPDPIALGRRYLQRLLKLVDQLLDFARLSSFQSPPEGAPWPLGRMVRMTVDSFQGVAQERGIELVADVSFGWRTRCSQEQVEKILLNLLTNALKFSPEGGQVRVALDAEGDGVCLSVADSGPGIPAEQRELIFERFYRVPAAEHDRISGAGIGLALVREAALANGGRVSLSSRPGHGSRFSVYLPAWRETDAAGPVTLLTERDHAREFEALLPLAGATTPRRREVAANRPLILVVEDNPDMRHHLCALLASSWQVIEARDGAEGWALACSESPAMIISDIMMPAMDGLSLLQTLRSDVRTSHIPVLLLTARSDAETRIRAFSLQADGYLHKPFDDGELQARLQSMLEAQRRLRERLRRELSGALPTEGPGLRLEPADLCERDRQLLERLRDWLDRHYQDHEVTVAAMAKAAMVDLRTLQRKLRALLDQTPAGLLQEVRLEKARELLLGRDCSIKDVAMSCGFSSPQAFSKIFSQVEGQPPSQWRRQYRRRGLR
ncbi:MAG: ATP-binding protein [Wenzhouxiangella sp.]